MGIACGIITKEIVKVIIATNERLTGGKYVVCQLVKGAVICDKCHF
jgi:hypothetical protein